MLFLTDIDNDKFYITLIFHLYTVKTESWIMTIVASLYKPYFFNFPFMCVFFFTEVHWFVTLYRLQVYNIITWHLYTLQTAHHQRSSFQPPPRNSSPLPILPFPNPFPPGNHQSVVCICELVCFISSFFVIFYTCVKSYSICLSPSDLYYLA